MHWFWRAVIAASVGGMLQATLLFCGEPVLASLAPPGKGVHSPTGLLLCLGFIYALPQAMVVIVYLFMDAKSPAAQGKGEGGIIALIGRIFRSALLGFFATVAMFVVVRICISCTIGTDNSPPPPPQIAALRARYAWLHDLNAYAALGAGLIAVAISMRRPQSAPLPSRCAKCGYDLTGNASGVCPECGTVLHFRRSGGQEVGSEGES